MVVDKGAELFQAMETTAGKDGSETEKLRNLKSLFRKIAGLA